MADAVKNVVFRITAETRAATAEVAAVGTTAQKSEQQVTGLNQSLKGLGAVVAGAFAVGSITSFANTLLTAGINAEKTRVSFETMLKSTEKASKLLGQIDEFAKKTPFQNLDIQNAAKTLLGFGLEADKILPTLQSIGDIASGTGNSINDMALIFAKAKASNRLFNDDLNILAERGIPVFDLFAKQFGVTTDQVRKLAEEGKISFANLEQGFATLSGKGGLFFNLMEKQSLTTSGGLSNLRDNVELLVRDMGTALLPTANKVIAALAGFVGWIRSIPAFIQQNIVVFRAFAGVLIGIVGSLTLMRVATIAATVATSAYNAIVRVATVVTLAYRNASMLGAAAMYLLTGNIRMAGLAFRSFAAAIGANPIGLIVGAIAAVTGVVAALTTQVGDSVKQYNLLADVQKTASQNAAAEVANVNSLVAAAKNESLSKKDRYDAIKKLNEISPEYLGGLTMETIGTDKATESINRYLDVITKKAMAQAAMQKMVELQGALLELQMKEGDFNARAATLKGQTGGGLFGALTGGVDLTGAIDAQKATINKMIAELNKIIQDNDVTGLLTPAGAGAVGGKAGAKSKAAEKVENLTDKLAELRKQLADLKRGNLDFSAGEDMFSFIDQIGALLAGAPELDAIKAALASPKIGAAEKAAIVQGEIEKAKVRAQVGQDLEKDLTAQGATKQNDVRLLYAEILAEKLREIDEKTAEDRVKINDEAAKQASEDSLKYAKSTLDAIKGVLTDAKTTEQEAAADTKEAFMAMLDNIKTVTDAAFSGLRDIMQAQIQLSDALIAAQEKRVNRAEQIAEQGNATLLELEQKKLDKLNEQRAKYVRQQQALALIELAANSAIAIAKAAAAGGAAAPFTIASTLIALAAGIAAARAQALATSQFAEGGYTGDGGKYDPAGIVHKGEFVIDKEKTRQFRPLLEAIHKGGRVPLLHELNRAAGVSDKKTLDKLDSIEKAVRGWSGTSVSIDDRGIYAITTHHNWKRDRLQAKLR